MAGIGATDLQDLAEEFLAACVDALDTVPDYGAFDGAPTRSFVSPGEPAADCCPQLTVHVASIAQTPSSVPVGRSATFGRTNTVSLVMTLFRCVEHDKPPVPMSQLATAAEQHHADGWAVWNHVFGMIRNEELFEKCLSVIWQGMRSLTEQGGCVGWLLVVDVQLDGYEEVPTS